MQYHPDFSAQNIASADKPQQPKPPRKAYFGCRVLAFLALLTTAPIALPLCVAAQTQPYSSSNEYQSMLKELSNDPVLPSHISSGKLPSALEAPANIEAHETATTLRLETSGWVLELAKNGLGISLTNKHTSLAWRVHGSGDDLAGLLWEQDAGKATFLRPVKVTSIERHENVWRVHAELAYSTATVSIEIAVISPTAIRLSIRAPQLGASSRLGMNFAGLGPLFGLGERFDRVKLDGLKTILRPEDRLGTSGHNWSYIPVPFLFTPRGIGIYLDTPDVSTVDLEHSAQGRFSIQLDHPSVDAYFFLGDPKTILQDYTSLTGHSAVPPPWAFGVWVCSYQGAQTVFDDAKRLRQNAIPASAIWTYDVMGKGDIMGWPFWSVGSYPNPRQFTDQLHGMGFKSLTYVHPYLSSILAPYNLPNPTFEQSAQAGFFVKDSNRNPIGPPSMSSELASIDFTNPVAVDWWEQKIREILLDDNFDGWMEDFGESGRDTDRSAVGLTGRNMANLSPLLYHSITNRIALKAKPDIVEFARSGYAGSQSYSSVIWGGDQLPDWSQDQGLPSVVRAGITAGLSGFPVWGPDIDDNSRSEELWIRWTEFGALTPIMRDHLWDKPQGAVGIWYDSQTINAFRTYARLHMSLFPYFYTLAKEASKTGLPIIRHPLLEFPDDSGTYDIDGEYMLGSKLLVAPVLEEGASSRSLYLPWGSWVNFWTGEVVEGGRRITVSAPLEQIPLLIRAGSILPLISPDTETLASDLAGSKYTTLTPDLTWRVFPAATTIRDSFTLDDGTVATSTEEPSRIEVHLEHSPVLRNYEVILPTNKPPREVKVSGALLTKLEEHKEQKGEPGWRMDTESHTLHVFFKAHDFILSVNK